MGSSREKTIIGSIDFFIFIVTGLIPVGLPDSKKVGSPNQKIVGAKVN